VGEVNVEGLSSADSALMATAVTVAAGERLARDMLDGRHPGPGRRPLGQDPPP
jgi:hypothetical protein